MCNRLHIDYTRIPPEGKAYKLAHRLCLGWGTLTDSYPYDGSSDGWIKWKDWRKEHDPDIITLGFCFLPTLEEAVEARKEWNKSTGSAAKIIEVDYKQGLGRFMEHSFIDNKIVDVLIAREFKIIREII